MCRHEIYCTKMTNLFDNKNKLNYLKFNENKKQRKKFCYIFDKKILVKQSPSIRWGKFG